MQKIFGKPIDFRKLKANVLADQKRHLSEVLKMAEFFRANYTPVKQDFCYICASDQRSHYADVHGFTYVRCVACGHMYTTERYSDNAIKEFYKTNTYYSATTYANKESCLYRKENIARPKAAFLEQYTSDRKPGEKWIDVGAGIGDLVSVVQEAGWKGLGLELSDNSVGFGRDLFGVTLEQKTLPDYVAEHPEEAGSVRVISFIGLLEHTIDPLGMLTSARALLGPDGYVMIQVPSADSLSCMIQSVFPEHVFRHMSPTEHVMLFSQNSLMVALEKTGFEPVATWFHGMDVYELMNNLAMEKNEIPNSLFNKTMYENMNELQLVFDKKEMSDRMICVAKLLK